MYMICYEKLHEYGSEYFSWRGRNECQWNLYFVSTEKTLMYKSKFWKIDNWCFSCIFDSVMVKEEIDLESAGIVLRNWIIVSLGLYKYSSHMYIDILVLIRCENDIEESISPHGFTIRPNGFFWSTMAFPED